MNQAAMKALSARGAALKEAMDTVMNGSTPDHGKWSGVNAFVRTYSDLAKQYVDLTGDSKVKVYDIDKLRSANELTWPDQKARFDLIYMDTLILLKMMPEMAAAKIGPLYNLLVGSDQEWKGKPFEIELTRCVREYTEAHLTDRYGSLEPSRISELQRAPCIFAYESGHQLAPKFGYISEVVQRQGKARISYDLIEITPFLTATDLHDMNFELDIGKFELYRTHWAVKEISLFKELHAKGITVPSSARDVTNAVDISKHTFDVALSFPGEARALVEEIAQELERSLGPNSYFYDNNYISQLAQPSLDTLLQGVYRRARLDVVFLSSNYQSKDWCGVEFRAVKEIIQAREHARVMFIRTDDGEVEGVLKTDGYVDARKFSPAKISEFIGQRLNLIHRREQSKQ